MLKIPANWWGFLFFEDASGQTFCTDRGAILLAGIP